MILHKIFLSHLYHFECVTQHVLLVTIALVMRQLATHVLLILTQLKWQLRFANVCLVTSEMTRTESLTQEQYIFSLQPVSQQVQDVHVSLNRAT